MDFLKALIVVSEKAANIARLLRQNERLSERLVEVKSEADANPRFQQDFKTLADVLIQEMVKHDIGLQFSSIKDRIHGEESNHFFCQAINEDIVIEVKTTKEDTAQLLSSILNDDSETAELLAAEVHREVAIEEVNTKIPQKEFTIDINELSIWIDPIDGTNEYIRGSNEPKSENFCLKGLKCVTVLIGVYDNKGQPVIGIINEPFFEKGIDHGYQCHWGVCLASKDIRIASNNNMDEVCETKIICIGGSENKEIVNLLKDAGYSLVVSRGAGYKLLTVVLGLADAYILSTATTFFWDTCAPQAILRALGGDIVEMKGITQNSIIPVNYGIEGDDDVKANKNGIIAYRNEDILKSLMNLEWSTKNINI